MTKLLLLRSITIALALFSLGVAAKNTFQAPAPDYLQFWTIARGLPIASYYDLHGENVSRHIAVPLRKDAYVRRALAHGDKELHLTATPLFYAFFYLQARRSFRTSLITFQCLSFVIFFVGLAWLLLSWQYPLWAICMTIVMLCLCCAPFSNDTAQGNVSRLYCGLTALLLVSLTAAPSVRKTAIFAAVLAILILIKPLLIFAPLLLVLNALFRGNVRAACVQLCSSTCGLVIGLLLPSIIAPVPFHLWEDFLHVQFNYINGGDYGRMSDPSSVELLTRFAGISLDAVLMIAAAIVMVSLSIIFVISRAQKRNEPLSPPDFQLPTLLSTALFILLSPLVWPHYYLLSILLALYLAKARRDALQLRRPMLLLVIAGTLLLFGITSEKAKTVRRVGSLQTTELKIGNAVIMFAGVVEAVKTFRQRRTSEISEGSAHS